MPKLSVNVNKLATLRNARGGNVPNVQKAVVDIQLYGAEGITVHPRPDERHIRYNDVRLIKSLITTEFNIEGNPTEKKFIDLVLEIVPHQVTLVPDSLGQLTSDHGWDTLKNKTFLAEMVTLFKSKGIRVSLFVDPVEKMIKGAAETGTDRVELYTESYATLFPTDPEKAVLPFAQAGKWAASCGLGLNAGHDLDLKNVRYLKNHLPNLLEVSIGHALISDALYYGLENTVQMYKRELK